MKLSHLSYAERGSYCLAANGKRLFQLMEEKKTNLAVSADVTSSSQLLDLAEQLGPEICLFKTHIDIIEDFTPDLTVALRKIAHQNNFLLFEDRKFADIGNTVKHQYERGIYHIVEWADIVNAHIISGPGIVQALAESARKKNRGLLLIAELSSKGHLKNEDYIQQTLKIAEQFADFVIGFITQNMISTDPHWINVMPGIKLATDGDHLGQQYITPAQAILERGADIIVVGRGIIADKNPLQAARVYRQKGWEYYLERLQMR